MKINSLSAQNSFGKIIKELKPESQKQKVLISLIEQSLEDQRYKINVLETKDIDVFISANDDGNSVDLKILKEKPFLHMPEDEKGKLKVNIHVPPQSFYETSEAKHRLWGNIKYRTEKFLDRGIMFLAKH